MWSAYIHNDMEAHQRSNFGILGRDAKSKLSNDNDIKIIIQGKNSQTGIGKTTLAIQLCRFIDEDWSADTHAFIDTREYVDAHMNKPKGSALLLDEIEKGADSRRAMSQENVDLSQAWATLRARNIATVCTLPSISMLDNRMLELADYWILVKRRGWAQPYKVHVNDFNHKVQRKSLPGDQHIHFADLSSDDEDKIYLDDIKDDMLQEDGPGHIPMEKHKKKVRDARKEAKKEKRNEIIKGLYENTDMSTTDLSNLDCIGISQGQVSRVMSSAD